MCLLLQELCKSKVQKKKKVEFEMSINSILQESMVKVREALALLDSLMKFFLQVSNQYQKTLTAEGVTSDEPWVNKVEFISQVMCHQVAA